MKNKKRFIIEDCNLIQEWNWNKTYEKFGMRVKNIAYSMQIKKDK